MFNPFLVLMVGLIGGFISGFLGTGCGIIITPFLMDIGIPPLNAVSSQLCHAVGTNMTNFFTYNRNRDVDFSLVFFILIGGAFGAFIEWLSLKYFSSGDSSGAVDKFSYIYIFMLIIFGLTMLAQSFRSIFSRNKKTYYQAVTMRRWMVYIPFHKVFRRSRAEMSVLVPIVIGLFGGLIVSSLGGGTNLFLAPILTYLIGRISPVVPGTTALAGAAMSAIVALVYADRGFISDPLFVVILFAGGSTGAWIGVKLTYKIKRHYINFTASLVILTMAARQIIKLLENKVVPPIRTDHTYANSFLVVLTKKSPILFTICCIAIVVLLAFLWERRLNKISKSQILSSQKRHDSKVV